MGTNKVIMKFWFLNYDYGGHWSFYMGHLVSQVSQLALQANLLSSTKLNNCE